MVDTEWEWCMYSRRYCSSWSRVRVEGSTVGMPGMNVLSCSEPVHRVRRRRNRRSAAVSPGGPDTHTYTVTMPAQQCSSNVKCERVHRVDRSSAFNWEYDGNIEVAVGRVAAAGSRQWVNEYLVRRPCRHRDGSLCRHVADDVHAWRRDDYALATVRDVVVQQSAAG